ncbi:MAG: ABC transporter ATP-binding protein [Verrucomicrobiales bacterium]
MIDLQDVRFSYPSDSFQLRIARLSVKAGETVAFIGPSGCGKTTLLNLISGILVADEGRVEVVDSDVGALNPSERQAFRIENIGLVPQNFELLEYLTIRENILVPFKISSRLRLSPESAERCEALAESSGISSHLDKFPSQLSQGERQRAALCRGLIASPALLLADEPTGNLDPENQEKIVELLLREAARIDSTVLMITHERELLPHFSRVVDVLRLRQGGGE